MVSARTVLQTLFVLLAAGGCAGGGCGGCGEMGPLPGGFPAESRASNAVQIRLTDSAIAALEADPAALVGGILGGGGLTIDVPASCGGDPEICCDGGTPSSPCGPLNIDLEEQPGDLPRLEVTPVQGAQQIDVIIRARLTSVAPIPVSYLGIGCDIGVDTSAGSDDGVTLTMSVNLPQDPDEATTRIDIEDSTVDMENDDVSVSGGFLCSTVDLFLKGFIVGLLTDNITDLLGGTLSNQGCVACESGTTFECGAFADACTDNLCQIGDRCEQRIGIAGRMGAASLFGGFSNGQLGSMDVYEVAGGYAETDNNGVSMGMYSGILPFAATRDRCGPPALEPAAVNISQSSFFQGNTRPDTAAPFGVGFGIHQQVLDQAAYAAYESGALCLNISAGTIDLLTTNGLAPLLMPSIVELLHNTNSSIVIGLRPQSPPKLQIGPGTTKEGEGGETVIDEALLDVSFRGLEIDFYVMVDDHFIRVMTLTADLDLPINLDVNALGEIQPVMGDLDDAITNAQVTNSQALRESDEELTEKIPVLLALALPALGDSLGSFALPAIGGLGIQIAPDGITSIEENAFLAIFADLALEEPSARVVTEASIGELIRQQRPVAMLALGADQGDVEFSFRVDGGLWSPFTQSRQVALRRAAFSVIGEHRIEVRARLIGRPLTTDLTPVALKATFYKGQEAMPFHGNSSDEGCACNSGASSQGWFWGLLVLAFVARKTRRPSPGRQHTKLGGLAVIALVALTGEACTCSADPACPGGCLEGAVEAGPTGRYSSLAASQGRVVAAGYDEEWGDLVLIERSEDGSLSYRPIAGVPDTPPTYDPSGYRDGIAVAGPDVGQWTSIQLHQDLVQVAYVDRDTGSVYLAREQSNGDYVVDLIDEDTGVGGPSYLSLSLSSQGSPTLAYLVSGVPSNDNTGFLSELRVASGADGWNQQVVDVGPISCAGFCDAALTCVQRELASECVAASGDCGGTCDESAETCVSGACLPTLEAVVDDIPEGVGLFASLLHLRDDSMVLGYYDRILGNLQIATSVGTGFAPVASYEDEALDTGMWLSLAADADDLVHVAFQDATGDRLMYASFANGLLGEAVFVDDGVREGENRSHPVGASASMIVGGDRVPTIIYQDGLTSDVEIARFEQASWTRTTLIRGDRLDGFFIDSADDGNQLWMSNYFYDRTVNPPGELEITTLP